MVSAMLFISVLANASETDKRIESSAKQSYVFKTYLQKDAIKVQSIDGAVLLTGIVAEDSHRSLAADTVENLPGVKSVDNQLVLKSKAPAESSDGWIGTQVKYSLLYHRYVSGVSTHVSVSDGIVTLRGKADNQAEKDLASEYAKDIKGVKDVKNDMVLVKAAGLSKQTVGEKIDDASITAQVKMAFLTHHSTSAFKTSVTTNSGVVTLSGQVASGAGKEIAGKIASGVNGVSSVINNMIIMDTVSKK
jgi:osmotically-inducible protein OsmY